MLPFFGLQNPVLGLQRVVAAVNDLPMDGGDQHFAGSLFKFVPLVHGSDRLGHCRRAIDQDEKH
jgi:hypothetical protein